MRLGAHQSTAGALAGAFELAAQDGCESLQIFSRSSRQWKAKPLAPDEIAAWKAAWAVSAIDANDVIVHDTYLINLCAPDAEIRAKSTEAFVDEIVRCEQLGIRWLNTHPGSFKEMGEAWGCVEAAATIDRSLELSATTHTMVLLENTAGQGSNLGHRFEHLRDIMAASRYPERLGVCIDTCHAFAAGYDLRTPEACEATFAELDRVVGLQHLRAFHLNDSKGPLGDRKDRHEQIGDGGIGIAAFDWLVNQPRFADLPGALETPPLPDGSMSYARNLALLKSLRR